MPLQQTLTQTDAKCPKCDTIKLLEEFSRNRRTKNGRNSWCKSCIRPAIKDWGRRNRPNLRNTLIKSRYGIDQLEYNAMFTEQKGCCAICKKHQSTLGKTLSIDHCHATLVVRGLLCGNCNRALGYLQDSSELLTAAIAYLSKHRGS